MTVLHADGLPSAWARNGMIRLAVRVTDADGLETLACEVAMTPHVASHMVIALSNAIAEHNGARACNVYAFSAKKRQTRRRPEGQT